MSGVDSKDPDVPVTFALDWIDDLVPIMERAKRYTSGSVLRPPRETGFFYECTTAGRSSAREPKLSAIEDVAASDGTLQWTARHPDSAAIPSISSASWDVETGLTLDSQSNSGTETLVTLSGGTLGVAYDVTCHMIASNGREYEQTITINVEQQDDQG